MNEILQVEELEISFGNNQVLKKVSFELYEQEVLGIIGPNGSGKTVLLDILTGILKPSAGRILLEGRDMGQDSITKRVEKGIGRAFQVPKPFEKMSVLENLMVGFCFGAGLSRREAEQKAKELAQVIGFSSKKLEQTAGRLSILDRKCLEIGRSLATQPKILLLDEVAGGLTEPEVEIVIKLVKDIKDRGKSVIWIEHIIRTMLQGTDRLLLLANGETVLCGKPDEVMRSRQAEEVYMGGEENEFP